MLRFLTEARDWAATTKGGDLGSGLRVRLKQDAELVRQYRTLSQEYAGSSASAMTPEQLDKLWKRQSNGVANIGQAVSRSLPGDDIIRQATEIVMDGKRTVGQRYVDASKMLGTPRHCGTRVARHCHLRSQPLAYDRARR